MEYTYYYKHLFPFELISQLYLFRIDQQPSAQERQQLKREFAFVARKNNAFIRHRFYPTLCNVKWLNEFSLHVKHIFNTSVQCIQPNRLEIGPLYVNCCCAQQSHDFSTTVCEHKQLVAEKEFVFDVDLNDYNDVRFCCELSSICSGCWPLMRTAITVLHFLLTEEIGCKHLLFVFSGRRGFHCWVYDTHVRTLNNLDRDHIVRFLVYESLGNNNNMIHHSKYESFKQSNLRPNIRKLYRDVLIEHMVSHYLMCQFRLWILDDFIKLIRLIFSLNIENGKTLTTHLFTERIFKISPEQAVKQLMSLWNCHIKKLKKTMMVDGEKSNDDGDDNGMIILNIQKKTHKKQFTKQLWNSVCIWINKNVISNETPTTTQSSSSTYQFSSYKPIRDYKLSTFRKRRRNMMNVKSSLPTFLIQKYLNCNNNVDDTTNYMMHDFIVWTHFRILFPRIDANVTKQINHLLKSPFSVHPSTGNICVPIPLEYVSTFDPTVSIRTERKIMSSTTEKTREKLVILPPHVPHIQPLVQNYYSLTTTYHHQQQQDDDISDQDFILAHKKSFEIAVEGFSDFVRKVVVASEEKYKKK